MCFINIVVVIVRLHWFNQHLDRFGKLLALPGVAGLPVRLTALHPDILRGSYRLMLCLAGQALH